MLIFFQGFGISAGLIMAIGAQNSFVLSQGVRKQHVLLIPFICSVCDAILICAGAAGVGTFVASNPQISRYAAVGGAIFLFCYGARSLNSAIRGSAAPPASKNNNSTRSVVLTTLALTFLNPHVYLDTLVLLGSLSGQFEGSSRLVFTLGACAASVVWFYGLSLGGTLLEPVFRHPASWKILDILICAIMWTIAYSIWPFA